MEISRLSSENQDINEQMIQNGEIITDLTNQAISAENMALEYRILAEQNDVTEEDSVYYVYDEKGQLIGEYDNTGSPIKEYIYHSGAMVALVDYAENIQGVLLHIHQDHRGAPNMVTTDSQEVLWKADFLPFGNRMQQDETFTFNARYPGQYYDTETGLHYNFNRYYDPVLGRYITSDPIGLKGGINTYAYVGGNPIRYIDPSGLCDCEAVGARIHLGGTSWYSHAALEINGTVYTNGRYRTPNPNYRSYGTLGPNVLVLQDPSDYLAGIPNATTYALDLNDQQIASIEQYYQDLISTANPNPSIPNSYILPDDYSFLTNNCSSTVIDSMREALPWYRSWTLPGWSTPQTLALNLRISPFLVDCICN